VRLILQIISWLSLMLLVVPALLYFGGRIKLEWMQWAMLVATVVWFVVTPAWMGRRKPIAPTEQIVP